MSFHSPGGKTPKAGLLIAIVLKRGDLVSARRVGLLYLVYVLGG
jgi:hypothetical protein